MHTIYNETTDVRDTRQLLPYYPVWALCVFCSDKHQEFIRKVAGFVGGQYNTTGTLFVCTEVQLLHVICGFDRLMCRYSALQACDMIRRRRCSPRKGCVVVIVVYLTSATSHETRPETLAVSQQALLMAITMVDIRHQPLAVRHYQT